jgi:nicotinate-nucleotide adenylyltransferase
MKVAVFGSAFNPPTYGHLKIIESLTSAFDSVLVVPCYSHNFGKKMINYDDRVKMAEILTSHLDGKVKVSKVESEIFKTEISRTYLLLKHLKESNPDNDYVFVCGFDNATEENWKKFYNYDKIDKEFGKFVIPEGLSEVRSTIIRNKIKEKESIEGLTKAEIIKYIDDNRIVF